MAIQGHEKHGAHAADHVMEKFRSEVIHTKLHHSQPLSNQIDTIAIEGCNNRGNKEVKAGPEGKKTNRNCQTKLNTGDSVFLHQSIPLHFIQTNKKRRQERDEFLIEKLEFPPRNGSKEETKNSKGVGRVFDVKGRLHNGSDKGAHVLLHNGFIVGEYRN